MSIEMKGLRIDVALGNQKADLVIKNAKIVNVFTKEIIEGDIAVCKDIIVGIGKYKGVNEIDAQGRYVCPGLIDSHVHIESTMVTPVEFAKSVLPHGTTTIIADPHEIANVCGINGIHFMLNQSKNLPMNIYIMIPSCVPATPFEHNGAVISAEVMEPLVKANEVLGLGEVMDYPSVISQELQMLKKIDLFDHRIIDGHSPHLSGKELNAYRAAGVETDHECSTIEEVLERLRLGMVVQIREGSAAKNLESIVKGLLERGIDFSRCVFCTDDKHLEDIRREGHISHNIKKAISLGVDPIEAISMGTYNAAQCYHLKRLGAVAPGYSADLILLNDLKTFDIHSVLYRGELVVTSAGMVPVTTIVDDPNVFHTVRIPSISKEDLQIPCRSDEAGVVQIIPHELITKKGKAHVKVQKGFFIPDEQYSKIAVIERHKATGSIGLGIVNGFGICEGAIATTIAHDSHNLIVIGDNDKDMLKAIEEIKRVNGGITIVHKEKVIDTLELPIAGLMSNESGVFVERKLKQMIKEAYDLGIHKDIDPFITLSFLALPVIPEIRITDQGLFDVTKFDFIR